MCDLKGGLVAAVDLGIENELNRNRGSNGEIGRHALQGEGVGLRSIRRDSADGQWRGACVHQRYGIGQAFHTHNRNCKFGSRRG